MWQKVLLIALAGAVGTTCRFGIMGLVRAATGKTFLWGTLTANMLGCFLAGLVWALAEDSLHISDETRTIILVGFMGALTTFSAYVLDSTHLLRDTQYIYAFGNLALQNTLGLALLFGGIFLGRAL